jgi:hypothetical protein
LERLAARILEHQHNPIDESQLISYGAFARLSIRELIFRAGRGELKNGASRFIHIRPQPAPMGIDDGPADRQPHPAGLRCVESLKKRARHAPDRCPDPESRTAARTPIRELAGKRSETERAAQIRWLLLHLIQSFAPSLSADFAM